MNKNTKLVILAILAILVFLFIILLMKAFYQPSREEMKNKKVRCDHTACPIAKSQNDMYKLHIEYRDKRDHNHAVSRKTKVGNFFYKPTGPANIFIIRHGEKIKSKIALDCNGILRSTYIPTLITTLNKKGFGIHDIITAYEYTYMHLQQTIMLTSWLFSIPLFMYGEPSESQIAVQTLFSNPYFNGKTVLICWEHTCIQDLVENIITIGAKMKGLDNYVFKNPKGTSGLPYWNTNNYKSILHFDSNLNFSVMEEEFTTCYKEDNNILIYGKKQKCDT